MGFEVLCGGEFGGVFGLGRGGMCVAGKTKNDCWMGRSFIFARVIQNVLCGVVKK